MEKWFGEACGNTFLVLFPNNNECQLVARHLDNLRHKRQWTFDTALALWPTQGASVAMQVIERDGSISDMCGNGIRVVGKILQLQKRACLVRTNQGVLSITTTKQNMFSVSLGEIERMETQKNSDSQKFTAYKVYGEPHMVSVVNNVHKAPLSKWGRIIVPQANCTIVSPLAKGIIEARTFERGVNRITQSCGTGACAAAYAMREHANSSGILTVIMHNHKLQVHISSAKIKLEGPAQVKQLTRGANNV